MMAKKATVHGIGRKLKRGCVMSVENCLSSLWCFYVKRVSLGHVNEWISPR